MKILLLVSAFNSQTQAVYTRLQDKGYEVAVSFAISESQMLEEIEAYGPALILCPFLKAYLPPTIYENYPVYIFHPGPRGDRGPNALEYALQSHTREWGLVVLRANSEYDGGDIYAQQKFKVRETHKASLYRQEIVKASLDALDHLFENISHHRGITQEMNPIHTRFTQEMRAIEWDFDDTQTIIDKINLSDSLPGVLDEILGVPCYLYGVHREERLGRDTSVPSKTIIAKRDGAICLKTVDGAVWISHLKEVGKFKLPATYVLKEKLKGVKEERLPLVFDSSYETFYEVSVAKRENVAYLHFNFHNGAMSTAQCIRLKYAVEYLAKECDVLVLMGGEDFFSNGIHLNILEESQKQGEDGWANINAMNDLIRSILFMGEVVTIASFHRNAGAGGVFLGLACDYAAGRQGVVLNPHYRTIGLSGSEYHTYTLAKRTGIEKAQQLLDACLPVSASYAKEIGMIDTVFEDVGYMESLHTFALSKKDDDFLWEKQEYLEASQAQIEACKEREIAVMYPEFWEEESVFHTLRREFVYKVCPQETPQCLKPYLKKGKTRCMNTV